MKRDLIKVYSDLLISRECDAVYSRDGSICQDFFLQRKDELIIQRDPPAKVDQGSLNLVDSNHCIEIESALWIKWLNFDHFGHMLTETVSSIWPLLYENNIQENQKILILIPSKQAARGIAKLKTIFPEIASQIQSVADLDAPWIKCRRLLLAQQSMVNKMSVDSMHFSHVHHFLDRYMQHYLKLDLSVTAATLPSSCSQYIRTKSINNRRNIYLSRSLLPEQKRLFDDEVLLENELLRRGWCVVHLEKLPLNIQLQLLREATAIAGSRGSAFHLLMALEADCLKKKKVVFLNKKNKPRKAIKDTFKVQFDAQGLEYLNLGCLMRYTEEKTQHPRIRLADNISLDDVVDKIDRIRS